MKETPMNERAVEAVAQIIESAIQRHGVPLDELSGTIDDAIAALAAARPLILEEAAGIAEGFDAPHLNGVGERIAQAIRTAAKTDGGGA